MLVLAMVLVFMVLLFEFGDFAAPMAVLSSALLSTCGVFLALLITGTTFNLSSFMGLIMVVGIVAKNGILLLDADQKFRADGTAPEESMIRAGERRLRPIMMTALATVAGMLPLAFAVGAGSQMLQPLAIAVIGGILASMVLSLVVTPAVRYYMGGRKLNRKGATQYDERNSVLAGLVVAAAFAAEGYKVIGKIKIGGKGGWDYWPSIRPPAALYVSHGTQVEVVDPKAGKVVGQIPQLHGVHGIAIAPDFGKGFITNGQSNSVTIFDLKTLAKVGEPQTGQNPGRGLLRAEDQAHLHLQRPLQRFHRHRPENQRSDQDASHWAASRRNARPMAPASSTSIWKTRARSSRSTPPNRPCSGMRRSRRAKVPPAWRSTSRTRSCSRPATTR